MSIQSVMPSNHLVLCHPLLLLPSTFPSIRVFSNESVLHIRWPKYRSFSFSISPSNEYSGLISFRFDLPAIQGILKSLLQHHSSKASISWRSAFSWFGYMLITCWTKSLSCCTWRSLSLAHFPKKTFLLKDHIHWLRFLLSSKLLISSIRTASFFTVSSKSMRSQLGSWP